MYLEHLDGTFSSIAAVDIRRDDLEPRVPFLLNGAPVVSTRFVLEEL